jgi:hypothetical protein
MICSSSCRTTPKVGVTYHWLVDLEARAVTAQRLESGRWVTIGVYGDETEARIARQDCRCSHIAGMCTFRAYVMAGAPVGTTGPGTGVQSTFDRSRLLHEQKSEASIADSVRVRVPPSCAAEFVELLALGGAVLALPGGADLLATRARRTDPRRTAVTSASLETNITWLTDTHVASRAAGTASPARRRGAARSPRRESRTPPARAVPAPTANSQPSPSV